MSLSRSRALLMFVGLLLAAVSSPFLPPHSSAAAATRPGSAPHKAHQQPEHSVPGRTVPEHPRGLDPEGAAPPTPTTTFPSAADVTVALPADTAVRLGDLPVTVAVPGGGKGAVPPAKLHARSLGHDQAVKLGPGTVLALALRRDDGRADAAPVRLTMDYSRFAHAYGADYADRLRLVKLPGTCADQPGAGACAGGTPVPADNNTANRTLSAAVDTSGDQAVYALTSSSSGPTGDYRATDVNPSQKWIAGTASGSFTDSYPIELPPPPYGKAPELALTYDSGTVDGRTTAANSQASWVGQGWDLNVGFIERKYKPCAEDGYPSWGDLCWSSPYSDDPAAAAYVISINGHTTELIKAADGTYRMRDDQSYKIEHHTGGPNDDNDGEYWVVSTQDGTQYVFGYGQDQQRTTTAKTNSNWTVPVISDDSGEPCHQSDLASCRQTYRWNLDQIHDPNENYTVFSYETETNDYRRYSSGNDLWYIRGGYLSKIEYGKTATMDADPPAYVSFTHYNRCKERTTVDDPDLNPPPACPTIAGSPSSYPDVPTDLICSSGCSKHSPSFFVTDLLDSLTAYVRNAAGTGYEPVTKYQLKHAFPATDDGTDPALWLDNIRRIGYQGGTIREAVTNFDGTNFNNRVDYNTSLGVPPMSMRRVTDIWNELGGETKITYGHQNGCFTAGTGAAGWSTWYNAKNGHWDTNTDECYPVYFKPEGAAAGWGVFHKYVTTSVRESDHVAGMPDQLTSYTYLNGAAWHHDDDMLLPDSEQTWGDWRGYGDVRATDGTGPNTERTVATTSYFRGMYDDVLADGTHRTTRLTDYDGNVYNDGHYLVGQPLQERNYRLNDDGSFTELSSQRWVYWDSGVTANGPGLHNAHMVREQKHLSRDRLDDGTWRVDETDHGYDGYGLETTETDLGDLAVSTDTTCTTTSYARNTDTWRWMIDYPETVERHQDSCTGPVISRTVTLYDGATSTDDTVNKPYDGNPTEIRSHVDATSYSAVKRTYDDQGRELTETDPLGNPTTTSYSPADGYPVNGVTVTNPLGQQTVTWTSRAFGQTSQTRDENGRITEQDRDALGRLVAVWLPTEPRSGGTPSYAFGYATPVSGTSAPTGPTVVTSRQLQSGGGSGAVWLSKYAYVDGFGRTVETQVPSPQSGGRAVTVTRYDSRGLKSLESQPVYNSAAAGSGLLNPAESAIPQYTATGYDPLERTAAEITKVAGTELWRTSTSYHGDHTVRTPPRGGQTVTWTDAFDKTVKVENHLDATAHQDTNYRYTPDHRLGAVTDPNGNTTSYTYDWLGHRLTSSDPDSGLTTTGYDLAGRVTSTTDARGQKVSTAYDALGRETSRWSGDVGTGTKLAERTYDTLPGAAGRLATATSYADGQAYTVEATGYDARYRVTGRQWTIPSTETGLAGTYRFSYGYDAADHQTSLTYPAAGGLPAETVTEDYTTLGLPGTLTGTADYVTGTTFSGSLALESRVSGTVERRYDYEPTTNRLSGITTRVAGATVQDDGYAYDAAGNVTSIADRIAGQSQCFGYDGRQRLTGAYTTTTGCPNAPDTLGPDPYNLTYTYDGSVDITAVGRGGVTTGYTYPTQGAGSVRPHAVTAVGADTYGYDADGNLTSRTVGGVSSTLTWDAQSPLAGLTTAGQTSSFVYDADGTRLLRRDPTGTTLFLDGTELTATSGGATTAVRYYTSGGATVAMRTPSALTWLTADQQGSEQLAITSAGAVSRQRYLPYGAPRGAADELPTDRGFLGRVQDDSTGLVQLGARYYDPAIARFISADPLDNNTDPDAANPYAYASDNPTTASDPTGLSSCWGWECAGHTSSPPSSCWGWECTHHPAHHYPSCWGWECTHHPVHHYPVHHYPSCWGWECTHHPAHHIAPAPKKNFWGYGYTYHERLGPVADLGSPQQAMAIFQAHPTDIFPFPITGCSSFSDGTLCTLHAGPTMAHGVGVVQVSVGPTSFTFTVVSHHYFDAAGSTITFSLNESHGNLYLSQHAVAPRSTAGASIGTTFGWTRHVWNQQAVNLNNYLSERRTGPLPDPPMGYGGD